MNKKIKDIGNFAINLTKKAGNFVIDKTKETMHNYWTSDKKGSIDATIFGLTAATASSEYVNSYFNLNNDEPSALGFLKGPALMALAYTSVKLFPHYNKLVNKLINKVDNTTSEFLAKTGSTLAYFTANAYLFDSLKNRFAGTESSFPDLRTGLEYVALTAGTSLGVKAVEKGISLIKSTNKSNKQNEKPIKYNIKKSLSTTSALSTFLLASTLLLNSYVSSPDFSKIKEKASSLKHSIENVVSAPFDFFGNMFKTQESERYVHLFLQNLVAPNHLEKGINFADYFILNTHDFQLKNDAVDLAQRYSLNTSNLRRNLYEPARENNVNLFQMYGCFRSPELNIIFNNPEKYVNMAIDNFKRENFNGIVIDFESTRLNTNKDAQNLVNFMSVMRTELDKLSASDDQKYYLGVAVSPRFSDNPIGYPHHRFYDFSELEKHSDFVYIMCYDFNVGTNRAGPAVTNEQTFRAIINYALDKIQDPKKIVILNPGYGRAFHASGIPIRPDNALSEYHNQRYLENATNVVLKDLDMRIETSNVDGQRRIAYAQSPETHELKLNLISEKPLISSVGAWKTEHTSQKSLKQYQKWQNTLPSKKTHKNQTRQYSRR